MSIAIWLLSVPLIAEWVMAPVNLWTGHTMPLFTKFTGFSPATARRGFAPVKLAAAGAVAGSRHPLAVNQDLRIRTGAG